MNIKKLLARAALLGIVASLMAGCCVFPYGPRGGRYAEGGHDGGHAGWHQYGR